MCYKNNCMDYDCKYSIANGVLIKFHVLMADHIDDGVRQEEEHVAAQHPMASTSPTGKKHCNDVFINELLLLEITNHINLTISFVIVVDSPLQQFARYEYKTRWTTRERMDVQPTPT